MNISRNVNDIWKLMYETAQLLDRTSVKNRFEPQLEVIQMRLQSAPVNPSVLKEVYLALTELRKQLRLLGYDLTMGKYTLLFDGFHNDDVHGLFTRMVLFIFKNGIFYWKTGDDNHLTLSSLLENSLPRNRGLVVEEKHYLWYRRTKSTLTLSGSATESAEAYERLKIYARADNLMFLSRLRGI